MIQLAELRGLSQNTSNTTLVNYSFVKYIDFGMRFVGLLVHLAYILFIVFVKGFQKRQLIYLHHVNIIGLIYAAHYCCYVFNKTPSLDNEYLNDLLCDISSMVWTILKFLRMNSLLLLALYRYIAVYYITFHRQLTKNLCEMALGIIATWTFCLAISFTLKYSIHTTYSDLYCFEGDSENLRSVLVFILTSNILGIVIPSVVIAVLYVRIIQKIKNVQVGLNERNMLPGLSSLRELATIRASDTLTLVSSILNLSWLGSSRQSRHATKNITRSKHRSLAFQFLLIHGINLVGSVSSIMVNISFKLAESDESLSSVLVDIPYVRPLFRIFFMLTETLIPILSVYMTLWKK